MSAEAPRALEFYSGIGGWSAALERSRPWLPQELRDVKVVAAFDINLVANQVYRSQPGMIEPISRGIQSVACTELEAYGAVLWMMSPPCQPYTRNNTTAKRDVADPRSESFLHLCGVLREMTQPPRYIALENVEGFESSESCGLWLAACASRGYHVRQFLLTPTQVGCPNERPRYYCLASLQHSTAAPSGVMEGRELMRVLPQGPLPVAPIGTYLKQRLTPAQWAAFGVPDSVLNKPSAWCFDIVTHKSRRSACYTKSYASYIKGTGSILYDPRRRTDRGAPQEGGGGDDGDEDEQEEGGEGGIRGERRGGTGEGREEEEGGDDDDEVVVLQDPEQRRYEDEVGWQERYRGKVRYLMPCELAALFHFPSTFTFPADISVRKCYELLGNSIHVGLAAELLVLLMAEQSTEGTTTTNTTSSTTSTTAIT